MIICFKPEGFRPGGAEWSPCSRFIYEYMDNGTLFLRKGVRNNTFVVDKTLTPTGFAGIEDIDWINIKIVE